MVGLPFASTGSVELKERMRYVTTLPGAGANAGQELYEVRPAFLRARLFRVVDHSCVHRISA
jgi:Rad3-related DNA helicase